MEYIHYGHKEFDTKVFEKIQNRPRSVKPIGGLWASKVDTTNGWIDWCIRNEYELAKLEVHFKFNLKQNAKVLLIDSIEKLRTLPNQNSGFGHSLWTSLDFEKISEDYDAIEVKINSDLYFELYGWDCDSILIMNPSIVEVI